jgi:hypothetical protein
MEKVSAHTEKPQRLHPMTRAFAFVLPVAAVIVACAVSLSFGMPIPIEKPGLLVFGALLVLTPFKSESLNLLQKVAAFYLLAIPVNQLSLQYFRASSPWIDISVSYSTIVLALCATGYLLGRAGSTGGAQTPRRSHISGAWALTLTILVVHMVLLGIILCRFYGFGYERDLNVLGHLCLYLLLFLVLWKRLNGRRFRQVIAFILTGFYLAITVARP